jgi:hypothetical protein
MSAIIALGQVTEPTPSLRTPITLQSAMNKFEAISQDILFGPGMVTRFALTFFKILETVDAHFYAKKIQEEMNVSFISFLLHPLSKSQSACYYSSKNDGSSRVENQSLTQEQILTIEGVEYEVSKSRNHSSDSETDPLPDSSIPSEYPTLIHLFKQRGE